MAKSRSIGGVYASLSLRDQGFSSKLKKAGDNLKAFGIKSAKYAAAGIAAGATGASAALTAGTLHTLDQIDALGDLSAQTGVAVADMMILQRAYKDGGREAEMAGKDIGKMQKAIVEATQGGKDPFASIGLSAQNLLSMNPADQFNAIGAAIMRIQNPAERTAKAMEIFGKGGMGLTTIFGGIDSARESLGKMPELAERFAGAMGQANDLIGHLPIKSDQFFTGFTAGIIGELLPGLQKIDNHDFTQLGENLGAALATGFEGLLDGTLFTVMSEKFYASMAIAIGKIQNILTESLQYSFDTTIGLVPALADGAMSGDYSALDPTKILERAASKANPYEDLSKELSSDADLLWNDLKAKFDKNRADAAAMSNPSAIDNPILTTDIPTIKPIIEAVAASPKIAEMQVNDYQRRGISLSGGKGMQDNSKKIDVQIDIMTQTRDLLKKIAEANGPLVFGKV